MALIGVVLMTVVLQLGVSVQDAFDDSTTTISERVLPEEPTDLTDTDPPIIPDYVYPPPPVFPPPPPPSGVEYVAVVDYGIPYLVGTEAALGLNEWVEFSFDAAYNNALYYSVDDPTPEQEAARDYDWSDFVATAATITSGDRDQYNQFEVTTDRLLIGANLVAPDGWPAVNWGRFYSNAECFATRPDPISLQIVGYNSLGDRATVTLNFVPETCSADFGFYQQFNVAQDQGLIVDFGDLANFLADIDGITGVDFNTVSSWTISYSEFPDSGSGNPFNAVDIGSNGFSINAAVAGPAYPVCNEALQARLDVQGTLPDSRVVAINIDIAGGDGNGSDSCYVPIGGP
jgi:hypothetical protein